MKILVRLPNWVVDAVMATPFLQALRSAHPTHHITLYGKEQFKDLLDSLPFYDEFIVMRHSLYREGLKLRKHHFNQIYICPNSLSSALIAWIAHIPKRIGYARGGRSFLLTHPITILKKNFQNK